MKGHKIGVERVAFSPNDRRIVSGSIPQPQENLAHDGDGIREMMKIRKKDLLDQATQLAQEHLAWLLEADHEALNTDQRQTRDELEQLLAEGIRAPYPLHHILTQPRQLKPRRKQ